MKVLFVMLLMVLIARVKERRSTKKYIRLLIEKGKAYYAFDSAEELNIAREKAEKESGGFKYNVHNRSQFKNSLVLKEDIVNEKVETENYVVRLKVEPDETVVTHDMVRGTVRVNTNELEDKILMKETVCQPIILRMLSMII